MRKRLLLLLLIIVFLSMYMINRNELTDVTITFDGEEYTVEQDELWVEVSLMPNDNKVIIREGDTVIKTMPCSGGTKDEPTVMGVYYLQNRGEWFYSQRFKEGALYWVRFYEQYLFHSVPVDKNFQVIEEEKSKIGTNASHGCIRLLEGDAKWFYYNVPDDTLVVIHE